MVSEEWAMPRMRVWGEWLNRDSSARLRVVVDGVGACFGWGRERSSRIRMSGMDFWVEVVRVENFWRMSDGSSFSKFLREYLRIFS